MSAAADASGHSRFAPSFAKGGALRQKVGDGGRVHLDRWLPFLVLNRSADPGSSIARRVAVNSPSYLVWAPEDDDQAEDALQALLPALRERVGPVLLIDLQDAEWQPSEGDCPTLPPLRFGIEFSGGPAARQAAAVLEVTLSATEIELRPGEVELRASEETNGMRANRIVLTLPQVHRAPDGRFYPQVTHELALTVGDALLRSAAAFMAEQGRAPAHHGSLGRSAFLAAAQHADTKLDAIARSFDFLLSVSPINTAEAMNLFLEGGEEREPEFRYRPLTVDPDEAKRDLYAIDLSILEDPLLEWMLSDKRRELDYQLTMLATRNTPAFKAASQLLYGGVQSDLVELARDVLRATPAKDRGSPHARTASEVAEEARKLARHYSRADPRFAPDIQLRDDVSGMLVSGPRLMIASGTAVADNRVDALLAHEVSVHLLTFFNGSAQGLSIFRTGLAHYEGIQEGLGVFAEWCVGGLTATRLRLLAGRVLAVAAMLDGADFITVYRMLKQDHGFTPRGAFDISARVFRSGGLAKDAIYLKGFRDVLDMVREGRSLDPFWVGKIAPHHVPGVEELLLRKLLQPAVFTPEFLEREGTQARIARLRQGLKFSNILNVE